MRRFIVLALTVLLLPVTAQGLSLKEIDLTELQEDGVRAYQSHIDHVDTSTVTVAAAPLNRAITKLKSSYEQTEDSKRRLQVGLLLLHNYYLKGTYALSENAKKQAVFQEGKSLGETLIERHPDDVRAHLLYAANLGRWAEVYGIVSAVREGVAGTMRKEAKRIIELDPLAASGGGYRLLAQIHYRTPYIPFIVSWPSSEKALTLLEKALNVAPDHPGNNALYGKYLHETGRTKKAKKYLKKASELQPRKTPKHYLEDLRYINLAGTVLNTIGDDRTEF